MKQNIYFAFLIFLMQLSKCLFWVNDFISAYPPPDTLHLYYSSLSLPTQFSLLIFPWVSIFNKPGCSRLCPDGLPPLRTWHFHKFLSSLTHCSTSRCGFYPPVSFSTTFCSTTFQSLFDLSLLWYPYRWGFTSV